MGLFRRGAKIDGLELHGGERLLASADVGGGVMVAATSTRLAVLRPDERLWTRAWHEVDAVGWDRDDRMLTVVTVDGAALNVELDRREQLRLAQVVRERVQASLVAWDAVAVPGGRVRVAVRKGPDGLLLQEIADPGVRTRGRGGTRGDRPGAARARVVRRTGRGTRTRSGPPVTLCYAFEAPLGAVPRSSIGRASDC